jgi:hypothetical protein
MDVAVSGNKIVAVYSDSFLRAWIFDSEKFVHLSELEVHPGHCCLKVAIKTVDYGTICDEIICYSGGTDGLLVKSSLSMEKLEKLDSLKVHQSGINAIAIDETRILTGGDDGMLALLDHNLQLQHTNAQAHHSTITAVTLTPNITSLSTDQRFSHWTATLTLLRQTLVQQPDPSTMYAGSIY